MKLTPKSTLADVAIAVGDALRRAGIRGVLTGGACAHLYTAGAYASVDVDFVLADDATTQSIGAALASIGFQRNRDHWVNLAIPFYVEFPRGPLGIGEDFKIRPVWRSKGRAKTLALSATDACRDRLAAYFHWNDRQSLEVALEIAIRNRVNLGKVKRWSEAEGNADRFQIFQAELRRRRVAAKKRNKKGP